MPASACSTRSMPGGFNHYEQSLRIVDVLENDGRGLNLTLGSARRHRASTRKASTARRSGMPEAQRAEHDRRADHAGRRPHRLRQPRHRRCDASGAAASRKICRASRRGLLGASSSARIATLVTRRGHADARRRTVGDSHERRRCSTRCSDCAAFCSMRCTRTPSRRRSSGRRPDILSGLWEKVRERPEEFLDAQAIEQRRARRGGPRFRCRHDRSVRRAPLRAALHPEAVGDRLRSRYWASTPAAPWQPVVKRGHR